MKILVTGGAGFIGSHIVDFLINDGHDVVVVDNLSTGNLDNLNEKAKFYEVDILSNQLRQVFEKENFDVVYHEAAQIDIQKSLKDPIFDGKTNILGTIKVLECVRDFNVKKIIYASSAAVYGEPQYLPVDEIHQKAPLSYYGISKYTPEFYINAFSNLYGFAYTIFRYANVYGVRQDPKGEGGVISIFTSKMLNGESPYIFGDGEQTRDYICVKDIAAANLLALTKADGEIINLSTNIKTTVNQLWSVMKSVSGIKTEAIYADPRSGDIVDSYLNNTKLKTILDFTPKYSLEDGIKEVWNYYSK